MLWFLSAFLLTLYLGVVSFVFCEEERGVRGFNIFRGVQSVQGKIKLFFFFSAAADAI